MNEMLDKPDLEILIKALNWNPACSILGCLIPCKHAGELTTHDYNFNGLCCAHWEIVFDDLLMAPCEICNNVYWWAGIIMTSDEPNPSLDKAMNIITERIIT